MLPTPTLPISVGEILKLANAGLQTPMQNTKNIPIDPSGPLDWPLFTCAHVGLPADDVSFGYSATERTRIQQHLKIAVLTSLARQVVSAGWPEGFSVPDPTFASELIRHALNARELFLSKLAHLIQIKTINHKFNIAYRPSNCVDDNCINMPTEMLSLTRRATVDGVCVNVDRINAVYGNSDVMAVVSAAETYCRSYETEHGVVILSDKIDYRKFPTTKKLHDRVYLCGHGKSVEFIIIVTTSTNDNQRAHNLDDDHNNANSDDHVRLSRVRAKNLYFGTRRVLDKCAYESNNVVATTRMSKNDVDVWCRLFSMHSDESKELDATYNKKRQHVIRRNVEINKVIKDTLRPTLPEAVVLYDLPECAFSARSASRMFFGRSKKRKYENT